MQFLKALVVLFALSGVSASVFAAQQGGNQDNHVTVVGKLTDVTNVTLKGKAGPEEHRLLKVDADGRTYVVDVGVAIKGLMDFEQGTRVIAVGNSARINDKPVVFAKYIGPAHRVGRAGEPSN